MKHIHILFLIINMIIGALVIYYIASANNRSGYPVFKFLILYLISFNIFIFTDFNYKYILYNITDSKFSAFPLFPAIILYFLVSAAETGIMYFLYKVTVSLKEKPGSKIFIYVLFSLVTLYVFASVLGISAYLRDPSSGIISAVHMTWIFLMLIIIFFLLSRIFIFSRQVPVREKRSSLAAFALLFSIGYLLLAFSNLGFYFLDFNSGDFDPLIFLIINLSPFIWVRYSLKRVNNYDNFLNSPDPERLMNQMKELNISAREAEIIRLIIDGKSNKEITEVLNISSNTVKNHVYNIYRKLGVNSRSQMIRLFNQRRDIISI